MEKKVILGMAIGVLLISFAYLFMVTFLPIPQSGQKHSETVVGFLLGSGITFILAYYYGTSKSSSEKNETIAKLVSQGGNGEEKKP